MKRKLPRALLIDLDDTILDDSGCAADSWREACAAHESQFARFDTDQLLAIIERSRKWFWGDVERHRTGRLDQEAARREIVRISLAELGTDNRMLAAKIADAYGRRRESGVRPFEGALETIAWLRESGCHLALVTNGNGTAQRRKIDRFGLDRMFDRVLIEGELGFGKPDPRIYRCALEALGVTPLEAWMVGDNLDWEVAQPQRMGIYAIWVDTRGTGVPTERGVTPDRVIRSLADLRHPVRAS